MGDYSFAGLPPALWVTGAYLYTWVEKDKNTTKCPRRWLEPRPLDLKTSALTMGPPRLIISIQNRKLLIIMKISSSQKVLGGARL